MRRFLHVGVEEANRMPWWQWRMYVEGLDHEFFGTEDGAGMAGGGEVGGDAASLAGLGFTVTGGGA